MLSTEGLSMNKIIQYIGIVLFYCFTISYT